MPAKKKVYRFRVARRYSLVKQFSLLKEQNVGFDKLKDLAMALFKSKTAKDAKSSNVVSRNRIIMKGAMNKLFMYLGIGIVVFGILGVLLLSLVPHGGSGGVVSAPISSVDFEVISSGIANLGTNLNVFVPYVMVKGFAENVDNVTVSVEASSVPISNSIYVLRSRAEQATGYDEFIARLSEDAGINGYSVNEIYLENLDSIPKSSGIILIIPTGYLPFQLAQDVDDPGYNLYELIESGVNVIYIGNDYSEGLIVEDRGRIIPGKDYSIKSIQENLQIGSSSPSAVEELKFLSPKYSWAPLQGRGDVIYGALSLLKFGDGHLIVFPNSLDGGWASPRDAADDVWKVIFEHEWLKTYGEYLGMSRPLSLNLEDSGVFYGTVFPETGVLNMSRGYVNVYVKGYSGNSKVPVDIMIKSISVKRSVKGSLSGPVKMLPQGLVDSPYRLKAYLNEDPKLYKQPVTIRISVYNASNNVDSVGLFTQQMVIPVKYSLESNFVPSEPSGNYVAKLEDSAGRVLSQMVFKVPRLDVQPVLVDWKNNRFMFKLVSPELDDADLTEYMNGTQVVIDGNTRVDVRIVSLQSQGVAAYFESPKPLTPGVEHVFKFNVGEGIEWKGRAFYVKEVYEEPYFWVALALMGIFFVIGYVFRAKDKIKYSLDVPDFEVRRRIKVPISTATIVQLIDRVNVEYGWKYMPLKLKEIKTALAKIHWQGRPLMVTDFNLKMILDILISRGILNEKNGYYGLVDWENKSGFTFEFLAMYRAVRDILITNAIKFTKLGESKFSDIHISTRKGDYEIVLGTGDVVRKSLNALSTGNKVLVLFSNQDELALFWDEVYKYGIRVAPFMAGILKGIIKVMDFEEFKNFIKS